MTGSAGIGQLPANIVTNGDTVYLPRGAEGGSDGVVAVTDGRSWQHRLRGVSEVQLMAADDDGVTVLVTTPGPATLHTVTDQNRATEAPKLDPKVADLLPAADQSLRIGDYLVSGFPGIDENDTVIGVVRVA